MDLVSLSSIINEIDGEISQAGNLNAYSRLFLLPGKKQVAKVCYKDFDLWHKNMFNLKLIYEQLVALDFPEIVFPTQLLEHNSDIVGYLMPYIEGMSFDEILLQQTASKKIILFVFDQVASVICKLPSNIHLGDLHAKNIIVSKEERVFLIDIDGFSVDNGYHLTCPLDYNSTSFNSSTQCKYFSNNRTIRISKNTDIYCLVEMFLIWLLKGINPLRFSKNKFSLFLEYLHLKGVPSQVTDMIGRISSSGENYLIQSPFICFENIVDDISYKDFLFVMGIQDEEKQYLSYIEQIIKENKNG